MTEDEKVMVSLTSEDGIQTLIIEVKVPLMAVVSFQSDSYKSAAIDEALESIVATIRKEVEKCLR